MGKAKRCDTATDNPKATIQKLKAICRGQQKEIARLRKELDRREDVGEDYKELLLEAEESPKVPLSGTLCLCPKCGNGTQATDLGANIKLLRCVQCDWRTTKK